MLSGEICTGKSTLANKLRDAFDFRHCKTRDGLSYFAQQKHYGTADNRDSLQTFGEYLDNEGEGRWVLDYFQHLFQAEFDQSNFYIVDSVRIIKQIQHLREAYSYNVYHVHLDASSDSLRKRFLDRGEIKLLPEEVQKAKYAKYKADSTEQQVNSLREEADIVIDTDKCNDKDVFVRVASFLRLLSPTNNESVDVIVGGQFGSEGKGHIAAHISPEYDCLVRVGGPNAGHTVFEKPYNHVFHLLPSGTHRAPNAKLIIGPGAVLNLEKLLNEIRTFGIENGRLMIDENAVIISPEDIEAETKVKDIISSTAQGVGAATANNIISRLFSDDKHKAKHFLKELRPYLGSTADELERLYQGGKKILLEGTQGTGLSLYHGLYPHVTSRDTTVAGCLSEAGISPRRVRKIIMVTRTYPIRVGGQSGPFISNEIDMRIVAERSGKNAEDLLKKEITTTTKKNRRIAEFSWSMFRRACERV